MGVARLRRPAQARRRGARDSRTRQSLAEQRDTYNLPTPNSGSMSASLLQQLKQTNTPVATSYFRWCRLTKIRDYLPRTSFGTNQLQIMLRLAKFQLASPVFRDSKKVQLIGL